MFTLQEICRKNIYFLPDWLNEHVAQRLGLYWEKHGSLQRIGDDYVLIQQDLIISINEALRMAGEEGNDEVVQLLLQWEGNIFYAIIGALEGDHDSLAYKLYSQIRDCHTILPLIQDPKIFEKCHDLDESCNISCLVLNAVKHDMLCILQEYKMLLSGGDIQEVFEIACRSLKYDIVTWMGQNIAIYNPGVIFDIAFDKMNVSLLSIGYTLLFNHHINHINHENIDVNSLLTQHLEWAAGMGLLHFMLETLKYGGDVTIIVLSAAVKYDHRKVLDYFLRRKNLYREDIEELLLLAISADCSKKTLNLLLSYLNYSIDNIRKKILQYVKEYETTLIIKILWKKKKINLIEPILADFIGYHSYTYMKGFMRDFSIHPERIIKMAARESREDLIIKFSKNVCKEPKDRLHYLKNLVYTMKHKGGKQLLIYTIHNLYKASCLESKEMFKLARFYARHDARIQFKSICHDLSKQNINIKNLLLECLGIAIKKNYFQLIETIEMTMNYE
ncbi:pMGF505-5R [African swine fever virus]|uniref:Protein MGF 505-5R n=1 Tax=African swine fever virus (isolate Tick/Malawi/Lil 20-1/1983) TaxID=10500 RepID=5055R_ASFM2|nr:RecName: Full=Protein MGF 505-5R [African swine fever virus Malawi LIL 20/1]WRY69305.1 pMGF505-5R [African swine fever virus]